MSECDRCGKKIKYGTLCHDCDIYLKSYCKGLRDGIKRGRAEERGKILGLVNWKSEQNYRTRVINIRIECADMLDTEQIMKIIAEQLKEQSNE